MLRKNTEVTREICPDGAKAPTVGTTPVTVKAGAVWAEVGLPRSSDEAPVTGVERRGKSCARVPEASGKRGDGSKDQGTPVEPEKETRVEKLQRVLYEQAKKNPKWRAWSLYGDVQSLDVLQEAMRRVMTNRGGAGVDGMKADDLREEPEIQKRLLLKIQGELRTRDYRPSPIRRVYIPKADGKMRPLGIPTVKDRIVQTAVLMVLEPIFEADFHEESYAYRPQKQAQQAVESIKRGILSGRHEIVDADLSGYFDSIPHGELMKLVARRVSDGSILKLIKAWLRASIVEEDSKTGRKTIHRNDKGTPQGGVISPLLANLYLDGLDKAVNMGKKFKAKMVRYADDFVILCFRGGAEPMMENLKRWLERRGLKLNEGKTRIVRYGEESLDFLGFRIQRRKNPMGKAYPHSEPSPKSCRKLLGVLREETDWSTQWRKESEVFERVNRRLRGWSNYYHHGNCTRVFSKMNWQVRERMRRWLWKRHNKKYAHYGGRYSDEQLHERHGLFAFPMNAPWKKSNAC